MANTFDLIDKRVDLHCPICKTTYHYNLVNIMGFSLDGANPTKVLGFTPAPVHTGETIGVAIFTRYPGLTIDVPDDQAPPPQLYDALTTEKRATIEEKMVQELQQPHTYIFTCPKDQKQLQVTLYLNNGEVKASDIEAVTPDNAALYVTGQQIQTNSLSVATSFCSAMVGVSTGSVAVYTGLLALVIPKSSSLLWPGDLLLVIPAVGFIVAAMLFALGAYPHMGSMRLSFPASIENFRDDAITRRATLTLIGFIVLCVALLAAFIFITWIAGTPVSISPVASPTFTPTP
ncbi:MAG: hypothetical protein ACYDER_19780 [Ktedonobacteraceae bacterium]